MDAHPLGPQLPIPSDHVGLVSQDQGSPLSQCPFQENWEGTETSPSCRAPVLRPCTNPAAWPPGRLPEGNVSALRHKAGIPEALLCQAHISVTCVLLLETQHSRPNKSASSCPEDFFTQSGQHRPWLCGPPLYTQVQFREYHCLFTGLCHTLD